MLEKSSSFRLSFTLDSSPNDTGIYLLMPVSATQSVHNEADAVLLVHGLHEDPFVTLFCFFFCALVLLLDTQEILQAKSTQVREFVAYCLVDQPSLEIVQWLFLKIPRPRLGVEWRTTEGVGLVLSLQELLVARKSIHTHD